MPVKKNINLKNISGYWKLYLLLIPAVALAGIFSYYPAASGIYHSFYRWDGGYVKEFVGWGNFIRAFNDQILLQSFVVLGILVLSCFIKMIPPILTAVCIHRIIREKWRYSYRVMFVIPMIIPAMVVLLIWRYFYNPTNGFLNSFLNSTGLMNILVKIDSFFHWGIFLPGKDPAWLGNSTLIIPSIIFYAFPWVSIIGVLIYLAGLDNISQDVYDAAEIDGVSAISKFTKIELPLIMTQIRLNLVLMTIFTIKSFGDILILVGENGGTGGTAMVPGLYMYKKAFSDAEAGYASAIGIILFVIIIVLTVTYQKILKVRK